jgi:DNA-binding CsgD family transcriptional regulator
MQDTDSKSVHESGAGAVSSDGLILLNSLFKPVFVNPAAAEILIYPQRSDIKSRDSFLANRIRSLFFTEESAAMPAVLTTFLSGRRIYEGHAYCVNALAKGDSQIFTAILLKRRSRGSTALYQASERFNLTAREQQVLQYLAHGLTTKEIAVGMEISPNTVKAFVHLIMLKMGVSTRSGIVGKALGTEPKVSGTSSLRNSLAGLARLGNADPIERPEPLLWGGRE